MEMRWTAVVGRIEIMPNACGKGRPHRNFNEYGYGKVLIYGRSMNGMYCT